MGPAMIITTGVLWLLDSNGWIYFGQSWPVYFLVAGAVILVGRTASVEDHAQPGGPQAMVVQPQTPPPSWSGAGTAPPPPAAPASAQNDQQVKS